VPQEPFKAIAIVIVIGLLIGGTGVVALLFAFRAFDEKAGKNAKPVAILAALTTFILLACAVLFAFALFSGEG
jgi:hypothetical protein